MRPASISALLLAAATAVSCGDKQKPPGAAGDGLARPAAPGDGLGEPPAAADPAPEVELDDVPAIDLVANRYLWHTYRDGLVIPVAGEGFRKYDQEYSSPWRGVIRDGGRTGRVLAQRRAVLHFPWRGDGAATLWLRLHPVRPKQRLTITLNDRRIQNLTADAGWQLIAVPLPADAIAAGENELRLELGSRGSIGGERAYALVHSLEIVAGAPEPPEAWPPLSPAVEVSAAGDERAGLGGFERLAIYVEIPPTAWLDVSTATAGEPAKLRVRVRTARGETATLLERDQAPGRWDAHAISLADYAGQLVELELAGEGAVWGRPRIALEAAERRERPAPYDNVILFVVDALRSDRLAVYGDTRVRTPRITAEVEAGGVVYRHNQAASPSSPPSHGSIQTGMIPRVHGVVGDNAQLEPGTPMISTVLGDAGISTAYYGNNPFGMGRLEKPGRWDAYHEPTREGLGIDCEPLVGAMLEFAGKRAAAGERFFISSLPYETHVPYRFHEGITDRYYEGPYDAPLGTNVDGYMLGKITAGTLTMNERRWKQLRALYDGEVEHMDRCFAQLLDGLEQAGVRDRTAVILTSDHGEGMYEHGRMGHAFGHYAELGNVPFVLIAPGLVDGKVVVDTVTGHIDIAPTIIDLMGVAPEPRIQGDSVLPLALRKGPWVPRVISLEYGRSYALRARQWKYIVDYQGNESVFDLANDPTEQTDLREQSPMALRYFRDLTGFFLEHRRDWRMREWGSINNHAPAFVEHVAAQQGDE